MAGKLNKNCCDRIKSQIGCKRSVTPRGRPGEGKKRKRKRKRERDRERLRRRGGLAESEKKVLEEENATMRAKLADRWDKSVQPSNIQS